jgi:NADH:ubiquinone oxidoreductase subunit E
MVVLQPLVSEFTLVGKLEDFVIKSNGRVKYLQLSTEGREYWLKVAKESNYILSKHLQIGCQLKVTGMQKNKLHKGEIEYTAYKIELIAQPVTRNLETTSIPTAKAKVLFCQKSTCWQRGGKAACELLQAELKNRGIEERVEIKTTGCLKQCEQAPNMVVLPDRVRYSRVHPKQILALIERLLDR